MRRKYNKYLTTGLLLNGAFLLTREIEAVPDSIKGFLAGTAIYLMMFGIYANCHDVSKFQNKKKQLIRSIFNK